MVVPHLFLPTMSSSDKKVAQNDVDLVEIERAASKSEGAYSIHAQEAIDPVAEKRLLWKLDFIMLPMFTLICE